MIKVLIVDDERLIIQGFMHTIDWESYGYEIIGAVENSKAALKVCEDTLPDIAILDINMSGMNGLELGARLKELNPDIVIIILTAYNEFSFAREAVRLQFDEYLLKPEIDFEDILETMEKFSPKILKKRKNLMVQAGGFIWKLLRKQEEEKDQYDEYTIRRLKEMGLQDDTGQYICLFIQAGNSCVDELSPELFDKKAFDLLADFMDCKGVLFRPANYCYAALMGSKDNAWSLQLAENIVTMFEGENISVTIGVSGCFTEVSKLYTAFCQAKNALIRRFYENEQVLLYPDTDLQITNTEKGIITAKTIKACLKSGEQLLEMEDYSGYHNLISCLLDRMSVGRVSKGLVGSALIQILQQVIKKIELRAEMKNLPKSLDKYNKNKHNTKNNVIDKHELTAFYELNVFEEIQKYHSFTEMEKWFADELTSLLKCLSSSPSVSYSNIIKEVLQYMEDNYEDPEFSLKKTAEHFYISYSYLSQLFSKEMSESFNHYLTGLRMTKAKKIVLKKDIKLQEVALQCGYSNTSYFIKVFKQITGMTPNKYRLSLQNAYSSE